MPSNKGLKLSVHENELKECSVSYCSNKRSFISKFCHQHAVRKSRYGHEEHKRINRNDYQEERQKVRKIIDSNRENEKLQDAVEFFDSWLKASVEGEGVPARKYMEYLSNEGVQGCDLLVEAAAFTLFGFDCLNWAVQDHVHYTYQLGARTLKVKNQRVYGKILKTTGEYIIKNIGGLLLNIKRKAEAERRVNQ